jgi:hypothetical protein
MPRVGFEPKIPEFERATVIGSPFRYLAKLSSPLLSYCFFLLFKSKYSAQNAVLKHPQAMFFP